MSAGVEMLVALRGVTKRWDASSGLAPASLTIHRGEIVALQGRSGSGKSTLLALLAGWCQPDAGEIVRGQALAADALWRRWQGTAGSCPRCWASPASCPSWRTSSSCSASPASVNPNGGQWSTKSALGRLDLIDHAHRLPRDTSLGQQQRVAVALAHGVVAGARSRRRADVSPGCAARRPVPPSCAVWQTPAVA